MMAFSRLSSPPLFRLIHPLPSHISPHPLPSHPSPSPVCPPFSRLSHPLLFAKRVAGSFKDE